MLWKVMGNKIDKILSKLKMCLNSISEQLYQIFEVSLKIKLTIDHNMSHSYTLNQ